MRAGGAWLVAVLAAAGCLESDVVVCADGRVCPAGLACSEANQRCVSQEQLDACAGKDELEACEVPGGGAGECHAGACLFAVCGDGLAEGAETCDGVFFREATDCADLGYHEPGPLSCDASCRLDESVCAGGRCGDEIINGPELCDGLPPEIQCVDLGYGVGALPACTPRCEPDTALCHHIGIERVSLPAADPAQDLTGSGPGDVWAIARSSGTGGGPLFHHGGVTWLRIFDEAYSVWSLAENDVYATVRREDRITLQHFDGSDWSVIEGVTPAPKQRVRASGPDDIDLLGGAAVHWDGERWSDIAGLPNFDVIDLWAGGGTTYLVLDDAMNNLLWRNDGGGWQEVDDHGLGKVTAVWGSGPDEVWIGGGRALGRWNGESWTLHPDVLPVGGDVVALSGLAGDHLYVVTIEDLGVGGGNAVVGRLAQFDGNAWTAVAELPGVHDVFAAGVEEVFLAGNAGTTFRYRGSLWRPEIRLALDPGHVAAGFVFHDGELFAAVNFTAFTDNGLVFRHDGTSWNGGTQVSSAQLYGLFGSGSALYAVGDAGLFRMGSGDSWNQVEVSAGPEPALRGGWSDGPDARFVVGATLFHDVGPGWVETDPVGACFGGMEAVWGSGFDNVFAVGGCGRIMHFDGETWSAMDSGIDQGLAAVWGRASDDVYAAGVAGTVLRYDGDSWSPMPPLPIPADLRSISGTAGELFVTASQGLVFHFDGQSWSQLEPDIVVDAVVEVRAEKHEIVFMSIFGTDASVLRLLRTTDWLAP